MKKEHFQIKKKSATTLAYPCTKEFFFKGSNESVDAKLSHKKIKKILFWTSYFNWKDFQFGMGQEPFIQAGCRVTNCMTTDDRKLLNESDAILFHPINFDPYDLPPQRNPNQRYIFLFYEAETTGRHYSIFNQSIQGFFNWTMSYRRDSDIHCTEPYGILRRKNASLKIIDTLPISLPQGSLPPDPAVLLKIAQSIGNRLYPDFVLKKRKKIAWFVSKCVTHGRREVFFRKLFDYFPSIDVFGECGNGLGCFPWKSHECDKILANYKFYISAENSICADYVTEKFYRALEAGAVPIVYGGADYSEYAPPHSYIHVADFISPKHLADYLKLLDANHFLYAKYFEWKKDWIVDRRPLDGWCDLCKKLNDQDYQHKSYKDIGKWWFDEVPCIPGFSL
jgi:alpha-1,3-fucosyltransferase